MDKMYRLHIENFLTIEEMDLDLTPGVQGFVGENAAGKTNILTAVQSILSGKHDSKLIKDGEKRSEIRLEEIRGEDVVASVSRIQTSNTNRLTSKGLPPATTPKRWLSLLLDEVAINPIRLISEDPVKYLKQHLPIKVEETEVIDVDGVTIEFDRDKNSFEECDRAKKEIEISRVATYRDLRHVQEVIDELRIELPPLPDAPNMTMEVLDDQRADLRVQLLRVEDHNQARGTIQTEMESIKRNREDILVRIDNDRGRLRHLEEERDKQNLTNVREEDAVENKRVAAHHRLDAELQEAKKRVEQTAKDNMIELERHHTEKIANLAANTEGLVKRIEVDGENVGVMSGQIDAKQRQMDSKPQKSTAEIEKKQLEVEATVDKVLTFDAIDRRYAQVRVKEDEHQTVKDRYEDLDRSFKYYAYDLPKILVDRANLPVKDLVFKDQELYVEDRHIDRLSTSERHMVAVRLAVALARSKGHIAIALDGIEVFDEDTRKEFLDAVKDEDIRVLYTRHGDVLYEHETMVVRKDLQGAEELR